MKIFYFLFYILNSLKKESLDDIKNVGLDERVPMFVNLPGAETNEQHLKILFTLNDNFYKKNLLKSLESNKYSDLYKLILIKEYEKDKPSSSSTMNFESGGLYKDWHFVWEGF